jgi:hypothetical protein
VADLQKLIFASRRPRGFFVLGVDGVADFDALHSRKHDDEVQFCAFDILTTTISAGCRCKGMEHLPLFSKFAEVQCM